MSHSSPKKLIQLIQNNLSDDLLNKEWRKKKSQTKSPHKTFGHCYLSAEALYHLAGKYRGFFPKVISNPNWTHWYLEDAKGHIWDPSLDQWNGLVPPYEAGKFCGFLTKEPSRRCQILMAKLAWSIAVKSGMMSISAAQVNGETRLVIYNTRTHSSELVAEMKLSPSSVSGYSRKVNFSKI